MIEMKGKTDFLFINMVEKIHPFTEKMMQFGGPKGRASPSTPLPPSSLPFY